ncbi:NAC domain-containing protein 21/22 [Vitis vinifera]|uniref:NAC domain-containing protein 21/22 n=1 Tax=Vitis vinifera TaxID=29760 RepID=A0A438KE30_VITVI|nr:NAC domain-containing protein 21/22 [Vitis vinifera]
MGLRDIGATLPPGFRFYPSDEELVCHYLYKKITNEDVLKGTLVEIDLHICEPWQLPGPSQLSDMSLFSTVGAFTHVAKLNSTEWYFFSFRDRKYATGYRTNRATTSGYWKATGKDRPVLNPTTHEVVGMRKTLVFYRNRAPNGIKTGWIMHEFRLETPHMPPKVGSHGTGGLVLCRVFHKTKSESSSKLSPQYVFDTTASASSPPTHDQTLPCGYQQIPSFSPTHPHQNHDQTTLLNLAVLNPNLVHFASQEMNPCAAANEINSKGSGADEYGFLWDMSCSLGDGVPSSNLEDMRFEENNSIVSYENILQKKKKKK